MKNITGYLKKVLIFFSFFLSLLLLFLHSSPTYAEDEFSISTSFTHTVSNENEVETVADISIKAKNNPRVLSFYTITIPIKNINPTVSILNSTKKITATKYNRRNSTDVAIIFPDLVISDTKATIIRLKYITPLEKDGNKIIFHSELTDINTNNITILYPKNLGNIVWSSNTLSKFLSQGESYIAEISNPSSKDTILVLGNSLVYDFLITRSLNNSLKESSQTFDITLPQDNPTQALIITSMDPTPDISSRDEEGNLTVSYIVKPEKQVDITISGFIVIMDSIIQTEFPSNPFLLKKISYWNISDSQEIVNLIRYIDRNWVNLPENFENINDFTSDSSKETFYKAIYKYIVGRLDIDKTSNTVLQGGFRDGASAVLKNVTKADADDYTDLCIALYRYFNIPARMNIGFLTDISGITENGIFHSWCEYYNSVEKSWVQLDPFLEDYKGVDLYKNSLKDHIKIITRGKSPVSPKLAFYTGNDFRVKSSNTNISPEINFSAKILFDKNTTTSNFIKGDIVIKNTGNIPLVKFNILKENIPISKNVDIVSNEITLLLLPNESISVPFNIPTEDMTDFNMSLPVIATIQVISGSGFVKSQEVESSLKISTPFFISFLSYSISSIIFIIFIFLVYFLYKRFKK